MNGKVIFVIYSAAIACCFTSHASAEEDCGAPEGLSTITSSTDARFLVFGETHGTVEAPAFFAESVCAVTTSGKKVLVGLEFPEEDAAIFQQFMQSAGDPEDVKKFLTDSSWGQQASQFPDGRTSQAMLALVQRLRELHANGYELTIAPFVRAGLERGAPYENGLASSLMEAELNGSYDLVMVLVGNVHAFGAVVNFGTPYEPMAMHLPQDTTLTLRMVSEGGSAWNCQSDGCGVYPLRTLDRDEDTGITLGKDIAQGYDGIFNIGASSASPPATKIP